MEGVKRESDNIISSKLYCRENEQFLTNETSLFFTATLDDLGSMRGDLRHNSRCIFCN